MLVVLQKKWKTHAHNSLPARTPTPLVLALGPVLSAPMAAAGQWELPPTMANGMLAMSY